MSVAGNQGQENNRKQLGALLAWSTHWPWTSEVREGASTGQRHAGTPLLLRPAMCRYYNLMVALGGGVSGTSPGIWHPEKPHTDHTALLPGEALPPTS